MPSPATALRLSRPLAWLALALSGCFGGPTSDFPNRSNDDGAPDSPGGSAGGANAGGNTGSSGEPVDGTNGGESPADAGSPPNAESDAAVSTPDAGSDAGIDAGTDAGSACGWQSLSTDGAHCSGNYCELTRAELSAGPAAACSSTGSLDAVCTSEALSVVGNCFRTHLVSVTRAAEVKTCAQADLKLASVSEPCVDCYVALHECMGSSCLVECGAGVSAGCEVCASDHCGAAFSTCSGLTQP